MFRVPMIHQAMGRLLALCSILVTLESPAAPNVLVIFCDDLGYGDLGCYGSDRHRTPNIDRLASEGARFTDFYVAASVCTPSRAALMTGCYPKRVGLHENEKGQWVLFPKNARGLGANETTVAELLREQGYQTAAIGKWHLGDQPDYFPTRHGFDSYFGIPYSNDMGNMTGSGQLRPYRGYPPLPVMRGEDVVEIEPDQRHLTQRYTEEAVAFIQQVREQPFFLYLAHSMPHAPQFSSEEFEGQSKNGKWGDTVEEIDASTGAILDALDASALTDNTIVFFLSDNGGATRWGASSGALRGNKGTVWEGGFRSPALLRWPGQVPSGVVSATRWASMDLLPTLAAISGGRLPAGTVIDGSSALELWRQPVTAPSPTEAFGYFFLSELRAVRWEQWKWHVPETRERGMGRERGPRPGELYDLSQDIGETRNVAADHPKVAERLAALARVIEADVNASMRPAPEVETPEALRLADSE